MEIKIIILMIGALILVVLSAVFPIINVIKPARWKDIAGFVTWCLTASYIITVGIYLAITQ